MRRAALMAFASILIAPAGGHAGLYNQAEPAIPLHADVSRFLDELARLRSYGPPDLLTIRDETSQRKDYLEKVQRLKAKGRLSAAEQANLGAYLIRLRKTSLTGRDYEEALKVLEMARREHPRDFYVLTNLGTAYQMTGQMEAAAGCLEEAYQLSPEPLRAFERYHLRLVQLRAREQLRLGVAPLDQLFPVRFVGPSGKWEAGTISEAEKKKLPLDALRIVQQLLVWLPDDGRLHWLLGEVANARGDVAGAYKALDAAVFAFRLSMPELKEHRQQLQEAVAKLPRTSPFDAFVSPAGERAEYAWELGWRGWAAIGVGAGLCLGLVVLQIWEWRRRRSARA